VYGITLLYLTGLNQAGEVFKRAVKGALSRVGEGAGRQLAVAQVVLNTVTAHAFAGAGAVAAIAVDQIAFFFTFHCHILWKICIDY